MVVTTQNSKSEVKWQAFTRFIESPKLFLLYFGGSGFYLLPKRVFQNQMEIDQFRKMALTEVPRKRAWWRR